jgi:ribosomal protein RSM22 (predicted rRNA methylase)
MYDIKTTPDEMKKVIENADKVVKKIFPWKDPMKKKNIKLHRVNYEDWSKEDLVYLLHRLTDEENSKRFTKLSREELIEKVLSMVGHLPL